MLHSRIRSMVALPLLHLLLLVGEQGYVILSDGPHCVPKVPRSRPRIRSVFPFLAQTSALAVLHLSIAFTRSNERTVRNATCFGVSLLLACLFSGNTPSPAHFSIVPIEADRRRIQGWMELGALATTVGWTSR